MVIHYEPARLRRNSDQPTAITNVLVDSGTSEIPLGTPTCSARTRRGRWALYPHGDEVVVVWPGGALAGPPGDVARELGRLGGDAHDDRACVGAIGQFLTDPEFLTDPAAEHGTRSLAARARAWSRPAVGYRLSGPANQPGYDTHTPASWPGTPSSLPHPPIPLPDPRPELTPARAA